MKMTKLVAFVLLTVLVVTVSCNHHRQQKKGTHPRTTEAPELTTEGAEKREATTTVNEGTETDDGDETDQSSSSESDDSDSSSESYEADDSSEDSDTLKQFFKHVYYSAKMFMKGLQNKIKEMQEGANPRTTVAPELTTGGAWKREVTTVTEGTETDDGDETYQSKSSYETDDSSEDFEQFWDHIKMLIKVIKNRIKEMQEGPHPRTRTTVAPELTTGGAEKREVTTTEGTETDDGDETYQSKSSDSSSDPSEDFDKLKQFLKHIYDNKVKPSIKMVLKGIKNGIKEMQANHDISATKRNAMQLIERIDKNVEMASAKYADPDSKGDILKDFLRMIKEKVKFVKGFLKNTTNDQIKNNVTKGIDHVFEYLHNVTASDGNRQRRAADPEYPNVPALSRVRSYIIQFLGKICRALHSMKAGKDHDSSESEHEAIPKVITNGTTEAQKRRADESSDLGDFSGDADGDFPLKHDDRRKPKHHGKHGN